MPGIKLTPEQMAAMVPDAEEAPAHGPIKLTPEQLAAAVPDAEPSSPFERAAAHAAGMEVPKTSEVLPPPAPPPTIGQRLKAGAAGALHTVGAGAGAVAEAARHPLDTIADPSKRRELERGLDNMITLGYGQRLADIIGRKLGDEEDVQLAATGESDRAAAPGFREAGTLAGMFMPGATSSIAKGGGKLVGKLLPKPAGAFGAAAMGGARGVLGYEATAPLTAALSADAAGNRLEEAHRAATDPFGLVASFVGGAAGEGGGALVKNSKGAAARELIEKEGQGASVGPLSPGTGGVFERELKNLPANDKGIGAAAKKGADLVLKGIKDEHRIETSAPYKKLKEAIDSSPAGITPRDIEPLRSLMDNAAHDLETAPHVRAQLQTELNTLERYRDPQTGAIMVPERQLNGLRRSLMRMAKVGATDSPGEAEAPLRAAAFAAKKMVDEGPYKVLNEFYAAGAKKLEQQRRDLSLKAKPSKDAAVDARKLKLTLQRQGGTSETAGGDSAIEEFRRKNPELANATMLPELQRARADLSFRMAPHHGGLFGRMGEGAAVPLTIAGLFTHPLATAAALGAVNRSAIAGRFLYPLARAASGARIGARLGAMSGGSGPPQPISEDF